MNKEDQIIALLKENNALLKLLLSKLSNDNLDFIMNVAANLVSERILNRRTV